MEPPTIYLPAETVAGVVLLLRAFQRLDRGRMPAKLIGEVVEGLVSAPAIGGHVKSRRVGNVEAGDSAGDGCDVTHGW